VAILGVLLPVEREPGKRGWGRPPEASRNVINGLWRLAPVRHGAMSRRNTETGLGLPAYPAMERFGVWESVGTSLAETMAESGHYSVNSTTLRAHVSAAGGKAMTARTQHESGSAGISMRRIIDPKSRICA
jgi:hypothetical protein